MNKILSSGNALVSDSVKLCPECGSVSIIRKSRTHTKSRKSKYYIKDGARLYKCKKCGAEFSRPKMGTPLVKLSPNLRPAKYLSFTGGI